MPMASAHASAVKTMFGVPAPEIPKPMAAAPAPVAVSRAAEPAAPVATAAEIDSGRTAKTGARKTAVPAPEIGPPAPAQTAPAKEMGRTTQHGYDARAASSAKKAEEKEDKTQPVRASAPRPQSRQAPIWTYIGVGFTFGLVLLGIYQLVGRLAH
jgi:hypothetical protein